MLRLLEQRAALPAQYVPLFPRGSLNGPCAFHTLGFCLGQSQLKWVFIRTTQMETNAGNTHA